MSQVSRYLIEEEKGMMMLARICFFLVKLFLHAYLMESTIRVQEQSEFERGQLSTRLFSLEPFIYTCTIYRDVYVATVSVGYQYLVRVPGNAGR